MFAKQSALCPHCDGNSYADKLKNPPMRKNQQKLKNQHAGNWPLVIEKLLDVEYFEFLERVLYNIPFHITNVKV